MPAFVAFAATAQQNHLVPYTAPCSLEHYLQCAGEKHSAVKAKVAVSASSVDDLSVPLVQQLSG